MAKDPLIYMSPTDPRSKLISPAFLKVTEIQESGIGVKGTTTQSSGSLYFPPQVGTAVPTGATSELQKLLPQLGDIQVIEEIVDSSTVPPTVNLTFRIKNSTPYTAIKGLAGRKGEVL